MHTHIDLPSNTREVGTQTGDSSQNKTSLLQFVLNKIKKGYKRLTRKTRLGENCINLVGRNNENSKESQPMPIYEGYHSNPTQNNLNTVHNKSPFRTYDLRTSNKANFVPNLEISVPNIAQHSLVPNLTPTDLGSYLQTTATQMRLISSEGGVDENSLL